MRRTYLFYDTETSGLNVAFDQVLRFAAIRTDEDLREIDRHEIAVLLRPDVIPAPDALLTTGLSVADLEQGACEFEAMAEIHALFNTPGTVTVGYNNLGFDDELLRFSFYRNFLPVYTHHRANGCGRMDLLPMTVMVRLFRRHWLVWPEIDGKVTLKLEHLNRENNLSAGRAHDAMVDVEAALELARRYHCEWKEWEFLTGLFDRELDRQRQSILPELCAGEPGHHRVALLAHSRIGADESYIAPVVSLGLSIPYKNQTIWLRLDKTDLADTAPEETWAFRKRDGDDLLLLNLRPKYVRILREERLVRMNANRRLLEERPDLLAGITDYHRNFRYPVVPEVDVDASLYGEFLTAEEEAACRRFRAADRNDLPAMLNRMPSPRLGALAVRVLGRNYPEMLSGAAAVEFADYMRSVNPRETVALVDYRGRQRHTPAEALTRISQLPSERPLWDAERAILASLEAAITTRFP